MKTLKMLGAALVAVTMAFTAQAAKIAKAVVADGGATLKFVYDETGYGTKGVDWFSVADAEAIDPPGYPPWYGLGNDVTEVIFDDSFAGYRPKHCSRWFYGFRRLSIIQTIGNLNTSEAKSFVYMFASCWALKPLDTSGFDTAKVTDMGYMFANCSSLTALDLSCFDTSKVENMEYMFRGCSSLQTIAVSDAFVTTAVRSSDDMFLDCKTLVGGVGTKYYSAKTDKTYARIDGVLSAPGYFTRGAGVYKIRFAANGGAGTMADQICVKGKTYNLRKCAVTAPSGETVTMTAVWK